RASTTAAPSREDVQSKRVRVLATAIPYPHVLWNVPPRRRSVVDPIHGGRDVAYSRNVTPKGRVDAPRLWRHPRGHAFSQSTEGRRWHRSSWPTITARPAGRWPASSGWRDIKSDAPPTAPKPSASCTSARHVSWSWT